MNNIVPGRYDDLSEQILIEHEAFGVIVMVINGKSGSGFGVSTISPVFVQQLPELLRALAKEIERENAAGQRNKPK